jgi:arsenate reductase-like glutaredoxin family protein
MVPKRAKFFMFGNDERCEEVRKFIENAGVLLDARDLKIDPLTKAEARDLVGYLHIEHFVNKVSPYYAKSGIEDVINDRDKVIDIIIKEQSLLKVPIVQSARLITIGCDKGKITEMLRLDLRNSDGNGDEDRDYAGNTRMNNRPISKPKNHYKKKSVSSK